jgi:hypothetical protein
LTYPSPEEQKRDGDGPARQGRSGGDATDTDAAFARIVAGLHGLGPGPTHDTGDTDEVGEDHFDPQEPPPLPIPRPRTVGGVLALIVGVLLLAGPNLLGLSERVGTPLGLFVLTAGIGWLVIGLRPDRPPEGPDDGARL